MRKILILSIVVLFSTQLMAQQAKYSKSSRNSTANGGSLPSNILTQSLIKDLSLSKEQTPKMNKAVYDFLVEKKKANQQVTANKSEQMQTAFTRFNTELKGIISGDQYSKFLTLKPKSNDPHNLYSVLFY